MKFNKRIFNIKQNKKGFTLIEMLIVVTVVGLLAGFSLGGLESSRQKSRDAKRLADAERINLALEMYHQLAGRYPSISSDSCCGGWDQGPCGNDEFIGALESSGIIAKVPLDPGSYSGTGCYGYNYYRYNAGSHGCDSSKGPFYVFGIRDMETSGRPHSKSPGWSCPDRDWQNEFDWVTGGFEGEVYGPGPLASPTLPYFNHSIVHGTEKTDLFYR